MMQIPHPSWIEIDLRQFRKNIALIRRHIGKSLYCLPVKANAYGHGLCPMGRAAEKSGVDYLAVAHLQEGMQLRESGVKIPILILGAIHEDQILSAIDWNLEFTISSSYKADLVEKTCLLQHRRCRVHLEVDTGMRRTGMRCGTAKALFEHLKEKTWLEIVGIYSHFAVAHPGNPIALRQILDFQELIKSCRFTGFAHLCHSAGTIFFPEAHFNMVRPSLLTFGYLPPEAPHSFQAIAPCFSLKAKVSYLKVVESGEGISYGHTHIASTRTKIATIPIGYGDGFRRALSNRGFVLIRGKRFPIVGSICMDQFMADVGNDEVHVGDEVVLIGKQGQEEISTFEIANLLDTIPYEVLCLFNQRLPRIYLDD